MATIKPTPGRLEVLTHIKADRDFSVLKVGKAYRVGTVDAILQAKGDTGARFAYRGCVGTMESVFVLAAGSTTITNTDGSPVEGLQKTGKPVFNAVLKVGKAYQVFMKFESGEIIEAEALVVLLTNDHVGLVFYNKNKATAATVRFTTDYIAKGNVKFWEVNK